MNAVPISDDCELSHWLFGTILFNFAFCTKLLQVILVSTYWDTACVLDVGHHKDIGGWTVFGSVTVYEQHLMSKQLGFIKLLALKYNLCWYDIGFDN